MTQPLPGIIPNSTNSVPAQLVGAKSIRVKPKSKKELSSEYDVNPRTIGAWCEAIGIFTNGKKLSIAELVKFYQHYGWPGDYNVQLRFD